ncbi:MAG TPA: hypothetical protein VEN79_00075 [Terriglobia bacterium]|nr:hypothetical protein [Terriglobia bacterium]
MKKVVAAGLSRHISANFNGRWRGKPAATTFFISLLEGNSGIAPLPAGGVQARFSSRFFTFDLCLLPFDLRVFPHHAASPRLDGE